MGLSMAGPASKRKAERRQESQTLDAGRGRFGALYGRIGQQALDDVLVLERLNGRSESRCNFFPVQAWIPLPAEPHTSVPSPQSSRGPPAAHQTPSTAQRRAVVAHRARG